MAFNDTESVFDPQVFLSTAGDGRTIVNFPARAVVCAQGDPANSVYYIHRGNIDLTILSPVGKEAVLAVLGPGDFFGEPCLCGNVLRMGTATAVTECAVMRVEKFAMLRALDQEAKLAGLFLGRILASKNRIEQSLLTQFFDSSEIRLAKVLVQLANYGRREGPDLVTETFNQDTLAKMVGTTRSRINYFMNKFRRQGLIEYTGELRIHQTLLNVVQDETRDPGPDNE